ncbi:MAG: carbon-nitrogen hydrolase family protein [Christensenellaceae bacterium]|nr:carbon-nitrogen hydrolase family protein [Christensenellaceae bacterium]
MKIALASAPVKNLDVEYNLSSMVEYIEHCSGRADIILFGESVLQGFDCLCWDYEVDKSVAFSIHDASIVAMKNAARDNNIAVSFGFVEKKGNALYSSQVFIGSNGKIVNLFHRVSEGWKELTKTDSHYREGKTFKKFVYGGKSFATAICGDLWTEGRPEEMKTLNANIVLWPVWCDYNHEEWNSSIKYEYAQQAALCSDCVLYVNPYRIEASDYDIARGGAAYFSGGSIVKEMPAGKNGVLIVEV